MAFRHYVRVKMDKVPTLKENSVLSLVTLPFVIATVTLPHLSQKFTALGSTPLREALGLQPYRR